MLVAGDTIIDWIIHDKNVKATVGGAGNIVRGLERKGYDVEFLTLYNPMLFPLSYGYNLHSNCLTDFNHSNVFVRDYDKEIFHRFKQNLQSNVIDVKGATAVICHEDSVIRRFQSFYADVRDTSVRGECSILRMSSSDDYLDIMCKVQFMYALVTNKDHVDVFDRRGDFLTTIDFEPVEAKDDIGAGDSFNVGFLDYMEKHNYAPNLIHKAIESGVKVAQEKVQNIGVFMNG